MACSRATLTFTCSRRSQKSRCMETSFRFHTWLLYFRLRFDRRLVGFQSRSERSGETEYFSPCWESNLCHPVRRVVIVLSGLPLLARQEVTVWRRLHSRGALTFMFGEWNVRGWDGRSTWRTWEKKNTYKILVQKSETWTPSGISKHGCEDKIFVWSKIFVPFIDRRWPSYWVRRAWVWLPKLRVVYINDCKMARRSNTYHFRDMIIEL
jgi:hypothetical protein